MAFQMNMSGEKPPKELIAEGWHEVKITNVKEQTSKAGNRMIVATVLLPKTAQQDDVYMITTNGKRWLLKSFLSACLIVPDESGVYTWDIPDVIGKKIFAKFKHEPNDYVNRKGETVHSMQHKVVEFSDNVMQSDGVAWDE